MAVLCVDAGTSMVKAVLFGDDGGDDDGRELALARRATVVQQPFPGASEQDMSAVWYAVVATVREVVQQVEEPVRLVSFTAQGDGCWLVDAAGEPTGPAILWNDARAADVVQRWEEAGALREAFRTTGSITFPGTSSAVLAWLAEHDPDRVARSSAALYCDGWLFLRLTGRVAVDESDAASPFLDVRARGYSTDVRRVLGLEWAERLLPTLLADEERVAALRPEAATELGLPPGLPVVMAPFDIATTAIGVGAVAPGQACSILGTTLCTEAVVRDLDLDGEPAGLTVPSGVPGHYLRAYPTLAGAEVVGWASGLLGLPGPGALSELAARAAPGAGGLRVQPYLSPAGERAPFRDARARGSLVGVSFQQTRADVARAVLEGLSFVVRECLEASGASPSELRVCGGGAASSFWCQLIADVTGVATLRSADPEIGARGAFLVGLVATGAEPDLATAAARHVSLPDVFVPDAASAAEYEQLFADFLAVRDAAAATWPALAAARAPG